MTYIVVVVLIFGVGLLFGRYLFPNLSNYYYELKAEISITDFEGRELGRIPAGAKLISPHKINPVGETGFWASVPLYFGVSSEAYKLLNNSMSEDNDFDNIMLNATSPNDVKQFVEEANVTENN